MFCPNCGQQQISEEMKFCSRCGLALSGLAEWLAGGSLPVKRAAEEIQVAGVSPRRKNVRRAAKLMFFSGVLFPIFLAFSIAVDEAGPLVIPFMVFFISLVWMLYARLFSDNTVRAFNQPAVFGPSQTRSSLPPANTAAIPNTDRRPRVRTNELYQPPSVTENTTKLLENDSSGE